MGFSARDVVPFTQARANLLKLANQAKVGAEKIITKNGESYVALIDANRLGYCIWPRCRQTHQTRCVNTGLVTT